MSSMKRLKSSEYHPGAYCRSVFTIAEIMEERGLPDEASAYRRKGEEVRDSFAASSAAELGTDPRLYNQFVGFIYR